MKSLFLRSWDYAKKAPKYKTETVEEYLNRGGSIKKYYRNKKNELKKKTLKEKDLKGTGRKK